MALPYAELPPNMSSPGAVAYAPPEPIAIPSFKE